jgi:hypothetical protein
LSPPASVGASKSGAVRKLRAPVLLLMANLAASAPPTMSKSGLGGLIRVGRGHRHHRRGVLGNAGVALLVITGVLSLAE